MTVTPIPDKTPLSVRRAQDRELIAQHIEAIAAECGATCERLIDSTEDRMILLEVVGAGGLCASIDLDGTHPDPDLHVISWNIKLSSRSQLNIETFGGMVNPHHKRKATYFARGTDQLIAQLERGLMLAASGEAFLSQQTSRYENRDTAAQDPQRPRA